MVLLVAPAHASKPMREVVKGGVAVGGLADGCSLPFLLHAHVQHEEYNVAVVGEEVAVLVEFRNPLAVKLRVRMCPHNVVVQHLAIPPTYIGIQD